MRPASDPVADFYVATGPLGNRFSRSLKGVFQRLLTGVFNGSSKTTHHAFHNRGYDPIRETSRSACYRLMSSRSQSGTDLIQRFRSKLAEIPGILLFMQPVQNLTTGVQGYAQII